MAKKKLTLGTLKELESGVIELLFDKALGDVVRDCYDRPTLDKDRTVELKVKVRPVKSSANQLCVSVEAEFEVISKAPSQKTQPYRLEALANGAVVVNPASPEDISQMTIDEMTGEVRPKEEEDE